MIATLKTKLFYTLQAFYDNRWLNQHKSIWKCTYEIICRLYTFARQDCVWPLSLALTKGKLYTFEIIQ